MTVQMSQQSWSSTAVAQAEHKGPVGRTCDDREPLFTIQHLQHHWAEKLYPVMKPKTILSQSLKRLDTLGTKCVKGRTAPH